LKTNKKDNTQVHMKKQLLLLSLLIALSSSCVHQRDLITFRQAQFPTQPEAILNSLELKIQPEDLLQITVHSFDKLAASPYNLTDGNSSQGGNMMQQSSGTVGQTSNQLELFLGYFVDREGYIDFPVLGRIQVGGLTLVEAKQKILTLLLPQLTDAVVNMRFLNFKITITGEVNRPGIIRLSNQRVTILEALGHGGDFTPYANRTNVLLIREKDGQRTYTRIDLTKADLFTSPYFYLQQNDVLYVEPIQAKVATVADPFSRAISYSSGLLAIITLIITLTR